MCLICVTLAPELSVHTNTAVISVSGPTKTWMAVTSSFKVILRQGNLVEPGPHSKWKCGVPLLVARYTVTHKGAL